MNTPKTWLVTTTLALASAAQAQSLWTNPVNGYFGNPRFWTNGVPTNNGTAVFGLNGSATPFTVTLTAPQTVGSIVVLNQSPHIQLHEPRDVPGPELFLSGLQVGPTEGIVPVLTLENGGIKVSGAVVVGTPIASGVLHLSSVDAQFATLDLWNGSFIAETSTVGPLTPAAGLLLNCGFNPGTTASATFANGSVFFGSLLVGANGATGSVTIDARSQVIAKSVYVGGGTAYPFNPGVGSLVIESGGTLSGTPYGPGQPKPKLHLGYGGEATLVMHDGALIDGMDIELDNGGTAHLIFDGTVTINGDLNGWGGSATMDMDGPDTIVDFTSIGDSGDLNLTIANGATLNSDYFGIAYWAPGQINVLGGARINATELEGLRNTKVSGAGSVIHGDEGNYPLGHVYPFTFSIEDGGQLQVPRFWLWPMATLHLGLAKNFVVPVVAQNDCVLFGNLTIEYAEDFPAVAGASVTLIEGASLTASLKIVNVQPLPGLFAHLDASDTALTLTLTDDVSDVAIAGPHAIPLGFEVHYSASALVDGAPRDVTKTASWTSSDASIAQSLGSGVIHPMTPGTFTLTANTGVTATQIEVTVSLDAPNAPFLVGSAALDAIGNGWSGSGEGPHQAGRCLSADGTRITFHSYASDLVAPDPNPGSTDVFLRDLNGETTEAVNGLLIGESVSAYDPCMSADGRFIAFQSDAQVTDVRVPEYGWASYLREMETGLVENVALTPSGGFVATDAAAISGDGRYVLFTAGSDELVEGDTNLAQDAFLRDRWTNTYTRVSVDSDGEQFALGSIALEMTPDARVVLFAQGTPDPSHVFAKRLDTGEIVDLMQDLGDGYEPNASISDDGRYVAFRAWLDPESYGVAQVFIRDLETNELIPVSQNANGTWGNGPSQSVSMSGNGRYVSFDSAATNLGPNLPFFSNQVWRFDRVTRTLELASTGFAGPNDGKTGFWTSISANGRALAFATKDPNFIAFDTNNGMDVLVRTFGPSTLGDINGDDAINAFDLALLIGAWNTTNANADLDGDGDVDASDLAIVLGGWTGS